MSGCSTPAGNTWASSYLADMASSIVRELLGVTVMGFVLAWPLYGFLKEDFAFVLFTLYVMYGLGLTLILK